VTEDEGNTLFSAQVSEPIPGEDAFNGYHQTVPIGRNSLEKWFRSGFHIAVEQDVPVVAHEADVHTAGVQVDATVKWVWVGVEAHEVSSSFVSGFFPKVSIPPGYAAGEASIIIKGIQATAGSVRSVRRASGMEECGNTLGVQAPNEPLELSIIDHSIV